MQITAETISGKTQAYLCDLTDGCLLHMDVISPFVVMQSAAAKQGFDLQVASGFRSYERQLAIWNAKASGERAILDGAGLPIDPNSLSDTERVFAILRWSALPGCSRHHWGTDMDVWDAAAVPADYSLRLIPAEYELGGPFYELNCWLEQNAVRFGFARPYATDLGGVAPEPWHLSYLPLAQQFEEKLDTTFVRGILDNSQLALGETVLNNLDEILSKFIRVFHK
ncbi:MAG: M15 family metallopeptidase [Porticoccus sp.]|nr:M15 family metallopeptidase [Porticoccus sp.]